MGNELELIKELFIKWTGFDPENIIPLPGSGSYRKYYRLTGGLNSIIGVFNDAKKENDAFIAFSQTFHQCGLPVPIVHIVDRSGRVYLQSDLGDMTLFKYLSETRCDEQDFPEEMIRVYKKVIDFLPKFQVSAGKRQDYSKCYPRQAFDGQSMMWDLNYFKYYFLKLAKIPFDEQKLEDDFSALIQFLIEAGTGYFMYRDFQSRNIMLKDGGPWFIDYQGGRKGPLQYDIVSLLYDAKASIPEPVRDILLNYYLERITNQLPVDTPSFLKYYYGFVLIRILQSLGAYGFRGYYENKAHFLKSIPFALTNLKYVLESKSIPVPINALRKLLETIIANPSFQQHKEADNQLVVRISSFSYKGTYPVDDSGNGGGFMFDCRSLPNPGKYEEYRSFTGNDLPVIAFLEKEPEVEVFLNHTCSLIDQSIRRYIERGFNRLMVNFGCTGGQHRSVYCANQLANHIRSKFNVTIDIIHTALDK